MFNTQTLIQLKKKLRLQRTTVKSWEKKQIQVFFNQFARLLPAF